MSMTKAELGEFVLRFLEQMDRSERDQGVDETLILDAVIVVAFDQPLDETDEDGDQLSRRGTMLRSTSSHNYRTSGLLQQALDANRS